MLNIYKSAYLKIIIIITLLYSSDVHAFDNLRPPSTIHGKTMPIKNDYSYLLINPETDALIVIDAQPTFMPGGGLAVNDGDKIIPAVRRLMELFPKKNRFATRDHHPRGHISLVSSYIGLAAFTPLTYEIVSEWTEENNHIAPQAQFTLSDLKEYLAKVKVQVLWPDHAIQGTEESSLHPDLKEDEFELVILKGQNPRVDSYSAFFDNIGNPTGIAEELRSRGFKRIFMVGLASDYCVGYSADGAHKEGFSVLVIDDATHAVGFPAEQLLAIHTSYKDKGIVLVVKNRFSSVGKQGCRSIINAFALAFASNAAS